MAISMNEKSKNLELKKLLLENESYTASTWGTIVSNTPKLLSYAIDTEKRPKIGSSNIYCYIGLTEKHLNIVTLHSLDVTRITGYLRIPLHDIKKTVVKKGILKSSIQIDFGNEKCKFLWLNEATGTDMKEQRKNVRNICEYFIQTFE